MLILRVCFISYYLKLSVQIVSGVNALSEIKVRNKYVK